MKFGIRLILAGFAALVAGGLFVSESFEEPLEGLAPTPIWKGILAVVLGVALCGFGVKAMLDDRRSDSKSSPDSDVAG